MGQVFELNKIDVNLINRPVSTANRNTSPIKDVQRNFPPLQTADLGNGATGRKALLGEEASTFTIGHGVYQDRLEYNNRIRAEIYHNKKFGNLLDANNLEELSSTANTKIALEIANSIVTENPYVMGLIMTSRVLLSAQDAKNTYDYSAGASITYGLVTNFVKPTPLGYNTLGLRQLEHKLEHSGPAGKWFVGNFVHGLHGQQYKYNPFKATFFQGTKNSIELSLWSTNVLGKIEKEIPKKIFKASKNALYGDKNVLSHTEQKLKRKYGLENGVLPEAIPPGTIINRPSLIKGMTETVRYLPLSEKKLQEIVENEEILVSFGYTITTSGQDRAFTRTVQPVTIKRSEYLNRESGVVTDAYYWQKRIQLAAEGKWPPSKEEEKKTPGMEMLSAVYSFTLKDIVEAVRDKSRISEAESKLKKGQDANYAKNEAIAQTLLELKEAGGDYKFENNQLVITKPPKKKDPPAKADLMSKDLAALTKRTLDGQSNGLAEQVRMNEVVQRNAAKKNIQSQVQTNAVLAANKTAAAQNAPKFGEVNAQQARAAEGAMYGTRGKEGLGIGMRKDSKTGLVYDEYAKQSGATGLQNLVSNMTGGQYGKASSNPTFTGQPTIGPSRR